MGRLGFKRYCCCYYYNYYCCCCSYYKRFNLDLQSMWNLLSFNMREVDLFLVKSL